MTISNVPASITAKSSSLNRARPSANVDASFGFSVLLIRSFVDTLTGHQGDNDLLNTTHSDDWGGKSLVIFQRCNKLCHKNDPIVKLLILIAS